jgi:hypothetical protein
MESYSSSRFLVEGIGWSPSSPKDAPFGEILVEAAGPSNMFGRRFAICCMGICGFELGRPAACRNLAGSFAYAFLFGAA